MTIQASSSPEAVVLGANVHSSSARGFNLHMLSPILVGLTLPLLVIGLLDPAALRAGRPMLLAMLVTVFMVSVVLFVASLIWQGEITSILLHSRSRKVEFIYSGLLATNSSLIDFDQVVAIGQASRFDDDGYPYSQAEMQLRDGQRIVLPPSTMPADTAAARKLLGLDGARQRT